MNVILIAVIALLIWLLFARRTAQGKGEIGERTVAFRLRKLRRGAYWVLDDVLIPAPRGTAQIDHVVVSVYGIFVIETKHYSGTIYGQERSDYWTQLINGRKEALYNPLRQNNGHIVALKALLGEAASGVPWIPMVCFSGAADIRGVETESEVVTAKQLLRTIKSYREKILDRSEEKTLFELLDEARLTGTGARRRHVRTVERRLETRERDIARGLCPRCGGALINRKGQYGTFQGCEHFPRCRFVHRQ
ncbi:NERD domain-containing protein [Paenibacillus athensensis]|uniref:NERD domain-containing protein n=1 Tax=Paenibacillus athensensis TaxID=1967502 RepID=A0A4Y8Q1D3_9BACL|nr:NERD domain-containing protein [Paenibacillus athensensis]MCD1260734.1 NERD domain-containing protein [Paenibacillus athensensis]